MEVKSLDNELRILNLMNESLQDQVDQEDNPDKKALEVDTVDNVYTDDADKYPNTNSDEPVVDLIDKDGNVHCDVCGTMFKLEDGTVCPVCGTDHSDALLAVDDPQIFAESLLCKYQNLVNEGKFNEAKDLLTEKDATVKSEGDDLELEAYKVHVDSTGKKSKVKVKTKHKKLSSAQKRALANARKKAHTGAAEKSRAKAMKKRSSMGMNESLLKVGTAEDDEVVGSIVPPLRGDKHVRVFRTDYVYMLVGRDDDGNPLVGVYLEDDDDSVFISKNVLTGDEALDLAEKLAKKLSNVDNKEDAIKVLKSTPGMMKESVDDTDEEDTDECNVNESVEFEEDDGFYNAEVSDNLEVSYGYDEDADEYMVCITAMNDDQDSYLAMADADDEDEAKRIATSIANELAKSPTKSTVSKLVKKYNMDDDDSDIGLDDTTLDESEDLNEEVKFKLDKKFDDHYKCMVANVGNFRVFYSKNEHPNGRYAIGVVDDTNGVSHKVAYINIDSESVSKAQFTATKLAKDIEKSDQSISSVTSIATNWYNLHNYNYYDKYGDPIDECDDSEVTEAYKIHVSANGEKTKRKVRTKRVRLSSAQKAALRKARKFAHTGRANKLRNKAMKKRRSLGLNK